MASSAEQMASNISLGSFAKATDLKKRLWFTLGALIVFRLLYFVPLPGIDPVALSALFQRTQGGVLDFFNMFSGGSLRADEPDRARRDALHHRLDRHAAGDLAVADARRAQERGRERAQEDQPVYPLRHRRALHRSRAISWPWASRAAGASEGQSAVIDPGMMFRVTAVISLVGGTMFLMWLGEQITSRGIGNGISLIIMAGIVAQLPTSLAQMFEGGRTAASIR